jgi:hypothetical protein
MSVQVFDHRDMVASDHRAIPVVRSNRLVTSELNPNLIAIVVGAYVLMVAAFWLGFTGPVDRTESLGVVTLVLIAFVGLPALIANTRRLFLRRHGVELHRRHSLREFLGGRFVAFTGETTGIDAAVQVAVIPVCLLAGAIMIAAVRIIVG